MQKKIFGMLCLCLWSLSGVFGVDDAVRSVSVTEGESVSLNTDLTEIQTDELIMWRTGHNNNLIATIDGNGTKIDFPDGRFGDRLKLDHQTASLTITHTRNTDSGLYRVTSSRSETPLNTFNLTVYARLPVPVISRDCSVLRLYQNCSVVCSSSVMNVSHVTLSWYKGMSVLSNISVSDLSISLSLPLDVGYQDKNTYSCVINNPISNQTTHLNITQLCRHTCDDQTSLYIVLISAAASLLIVVAVGSAIFWICRKTDHEVQSGEEITYADPTFYKRKAQKSRVQEEEDVVYAGVAMRH